MEHENTKVFESATAEDVAVALLRPLTSLEKQFVPALLSKAERKLSAVFPNGLKVEPECGYQTVTDVQAEMVARRLRNPEGMVQEGDGEYNYRRDLELASGRLEITDSDLEELGLTSGGWQVINPILAREGR